MSQALNHKSPDLELYALHEYSLTILSSLLITKFRSVNILFKYLINNLKQIKY